MLLAFSFVASPACAFGPGGGGSPHSAGASRLGIASGLAFASTSTLGSLATLAGSSPDPPPVIKEMTPHAGAPGAETEVTIKGENLEVEGRETFVHIYYTDIIAEDQEVTVTPQSPTEIKAKLPEHKPGGELPRPGLVELKVCVVGGSVTNCSNGVPFTYASAPSVTGVEARGGPLTGGNAIKIYGHEFVPEETEVKLAGKSSEATITKECSLALTSDCATVQGTDEIEAKLPAAPGGAAEAVDVRVKTKLGESPASADDRYTYGPTLTSIKPAGGPVAGTNKVEIEGVGLEGARSVEFVSRGGAHGLGEILAVKNGGTELEAKVPAAPEGKPETVAVRVETREGKSPAEDCAEALQAPACYSFGLPAVERLAPAAGGIHGGSEIEIEGQNLQGASAVEFGAEQAASFEVISPTQIRAVAPGEAEGTVDVRVTGETGEKSPLSTADRFSFQSVPASEGVPWPVLVTKVENLQAPGGAYYGRAEGGIAGGERVLIYGGEFEGVSEVRFGGTPVKHFTVKFLYGYRNESSGAHANFEIETETPPHEKGTVDVTIVTASGTSVTMPSDRFAYGEPLAGLAEAPFGINSLEAGTCSLLSCAYRSAAEESPFFAQAAGQAPFFSLGFATNGAEADHNSAGEHGIGLPSGSLRSLRVDLPAGMAFNPQALAVGEQVGVAVLRVRLHERGGHGLDANYAVYRPVKNMGPVQGAPLELELSVPEVLERDNGIGTLPVYIRGGLSWHREKEAEHHHEHDGTATAQANGLATGDYHAYSMTTGVALRGKVPGIPDIQSPLVAQRLILFGNAAGSGFITLPSQCGGSLAYHLSAQSWGAQELKEPVNGISGESETAEATTETPAPVRGCGKLTFKPQITVTPEPSSGPDQPDGASVEVKLPQNASPLELDSADVKQVSATLPEGMTLDPSAANHLQACSEEEFGIEANGVVKEGKSESEAAEITCKPEAKIGTFEVLSPDLPPPSEAEAKEGVRGNLRGSIYLATPLSSEPASGQEYRIFMAAEAPNYNVGVRLIGHVRANERTGRLEATVATPQLPFSAAIMHFNGGPEAPLANPLTCGNKTEALFTPYGGPEGPAPFSPASQELNLAGCPSFAPPFSLSQSTQESNAQAGASPTFTLAISRDVGQQYISQLKTTLPEGLLGSIASVPKLCEEPSASRGQCPPESQIGTAVVATGSGTPFSLQGPVYLTGETEGAPYGLSIPVNAEHVGPYDYGIITTRAKIEVDPYTARVTTTASPPQIVGGAPVRLRQVQITLNRPGFLVNPTGCQALETETLATSTSGQSDPVSSPFEVQGCFGLPFSPSFSASTSANTSRADGASLSVTLTPPPHGANLKEVKVTLPKQLVSRLSTLQHACTEAQAAADILSCPPLSRVAKATLTTPLLPAPLSGYGVLVSHGGRAFPDLDFILEGDGIRLIEVSHTDIRDGITTSTFPELPDAPFTSFDATFPQGGDSLLDANGSFCRQTVTTTKHELLAVNHSLLRRHGHLFLRSGRSLLRVVGKLVRHHGRLFARVERNVSGRGPVALLMPTTLTAQNGKRLTQATRIKVSGCLAAAPSLAVVSSRVKGKALLLTLKGSARGILTIAGGGINETHATLAAGTHTVTVRLTNAGLKLAGRQHRLTVKLGLRPPGHYAAEETVGVRV